MYTDMSFPTSDAIYWADHIYERYSKISEEADFADWVRASVQYPDYTLWGPSGVNPNDVAQGNLGNCWVINALSALAEYPERIYNLFHNSFKSEKGIYAVNIYALGVPYTIFVDDYLPLRESGELLFAQIGSDQALWGPLLEKAIAKYVGNYWHMDVGQNFDSIGFLTGGPNYFISHYTALDNFEKDRIWNEIKAHNHNRELITTKSSANQAEDSNIQPAHAYCVLD